MPVDEAILFAANNLFKNAQLPPGAPQPFPVVIDPLIDGNTWVRTRATEAMGATISSLVKEKFPQFQMAPFSSNMLAKAPLLFIGTFTPVDMEGKNAGPREWYRVCLALIDLRSGKIVSKGFARARPDGIDHTPTLFFQDAPAWSSDAGTIGYVGTCQGTKPGDQIKAEYWDKILSAAMINDAINAYEAGRYQEALDLYRGAQRAGAADSMRVFNGIYLTTWKLGRKEDAAEAFGRIVDHGLERKRLGVKFLFRPGSTLFVADEQVSGPYKIWLSEIGKRTRSGAECLEVSGHSSRTGPEPLNVRLSQARAEYVRNEITGGREPIVRKILATGKGSSEAISGLGTDDARDAIDRRVEFKVIPCTGA
jgi:outer membrane protein OmpA-like peptidoglycan-associated protein